MSYLVKIRAAWNIMMTKAFCKYLDKILPEKKKKNTVERKGKFILKVIAYPVCIADPVHTVGTVC